MSNQHRSQPNPLRSEQFLLDCSPNGDKKFLQNVIALWPMNFLHFLHLPNSREQMGVQSDSTAIIYRLQETYDSIKRDNLYKNLIESSIPKKLGRQIKMCLSVTSRKMCVAKYMSNTFPIQNGLKEGDTVFQFHLRICHQESPRQSGRFGIEWDISAFWSIC